MSNATHSDTSALRSHLLALEKADLHVHFEGSIRPQLLTKLCKKNGIDPNSPVRMPSGNQFTPASRNTSFVSFPSFAEFIGSYLKNTEALVTTEDIAIAAIDFAAQCQEQNVKSCELNLSISSFVALGWDVSQLFAGLLDAQRRVNEEFSITFRWIFDIVRNASENGEEVLKQAIDARKKGVDVVAIGLSGDESLKSPEPFKQAFQNAKSEEFLTYAHAGETLGADFISRTIDCLAPTRIGHGLSVVDDQDLIKRCVDQNIVFEVCPWSNLLLGNRNKDNHPIARMINSGLTVVIGSDDPGLFEKDLTDNFLLAAELGVDPISLESAAASSLQTN